MDITQFFKPQKGVQKKEHPTKINQRNKFKQQYLNLIGQMVHAGYIDILEYTHLVNFMKTGGTIVEMGRFNQIRDKIKSSGLDEDSKRDFGIVCHQLFHHLFSLFDENGKVNVKLILEDMVNCDEIAIEYTGDQIQAIQEIFQFLYDTNQKVFGLYGYAGTGKTTLITKLIHYLLLRMYISSVGLSAPTNKAVNVLKSKFKNDITHLLAQKSIHNTDQNASLNEQLDHLEDSGFKVNFLTIHKLLRYKNDFDVEGERIFVKGDKSNLDTYDLIVIDECSMIPFQMIATIFEEVKNQVRSIGKDQIAKRVPKILFIGDPAQLPPVNERVSIVFSKDPRDFNFEIYKKMIDYNSNAYEKNKDDDIKKKFQQFQNDVINLRSVTLAQVVRSNDNQVVGLCNNVREWVIGLIKEPKIGIFRGKKVKLYQLKKGEDRLKSDWFKTAVEYFMDEKTTISNIILAWTNERCLEYNTKIRQIRNNKKELNQFEKGDILVLRDFYNIKETEVVEHPSKKEGKEETKKFYTSEQIKVVEIEEVTKAIPKFSEALPGKLQKMDNYAYIEDKYKKTVRAINKACAFKYEVYKLYVTKLTDALATNTVPEVYQIYVIKDKSRPQLDADGNMASANIKELRKLYRGYFKEHMDRLDKEVIRPLWREWNKRFFEPFADVMSGFCNTTHRSQGSDFYNVFVDGDDILRNPNGNEAKRCIYTALTRTSNILSILI